MQSPSLPSFGSQTPESPLEEDRSYNLPALRSREDSLSLPSSPKSASPGPPDESVQCWKDYVQELPFLPDPRPRAITPLGFRDHEPVGEQPKPMALYQSSPWFKVPPNIRRDILRLAFGDHRLHMSLFLQRQYPFDDIPESKDIQATMKWQWFGCICHRLVVPDQLPAPMTSGANHLGPWADTCKSGDPLRGYMGAMGWLLSCRQNYAEGIDVLYSTNTITMSGEAMITHLPRLLVPQRLASLTSIEIRWPLKSLPLEELKSEDHYHSTYFAVHQGIAPFSLDLDQLSVGLDALSSTHFPSLRRLYISFEKFYNWQGFSRYLTYVFLLQKLREFVKMRSKPLDECAFAFPEAIYQHITSSDPSGLKRDSFSQAWDSLDGNLHMIRIPYKDSYPDPPFHLEDRHKRGFWILEGCEIHEWFRWEYPGRSSSNFDSNFSPRSPIYSPASPEWSSPASHTSVV